MTADIYIVGKISIHHYVMADMIVVIIETRASRCYHVHGLALAWVLGWWLGRIADPESIARHFGSRRTHTHTDARTQHGFGLAIAVWSVCRLWWPYGYVIYTRQQSSYSTQVSVAVEVS